MRVIRFNWCAPHWCHGFHLGFFYWNLHFGIMFKEDAPCPECYGSKLPIRIFFTIWRWDNE